jgi:Tol biopolymer transport system component/predicted Ser/Thr protein kinase
MGEVYRARDTRLDRDVAIKVLPEPLTRDAERVARFQREAKLLASLNHPHIAHVYGFEEADGKKFLVLEYVEGETLAHRLQRGAMPVEESQELGIQVAEALEAAHEKGIIHRDLKPGNVMVTLAGAAKVLDFGLAKALSEESGISGPTDSPTITAHYTRPGVILGTAAYMSPEQARGRSVDKRTDIWSFGCLLYECLTGRRAFDGETSTDVIGAILHKEPDWAALPADTPALVQFVLRRCLAKDRNKRLRDIGDARVDLETALTDPTSSGFLLAGAAIAGGARRPRRGVVLVAVLLVPVLLFGAGLGWRVRALRESVPPPVVRFNVEVPPPFEYAIGEGSNLNSMSLNRNGTMLAFTAHSEGVNRIFVRDFAAAEARCLTGTEGGTNPFFSPDGRWLGFLAGGKLMRVPLSGGLTLTICDANASGGTIWLEDGTVVYGIPGGSRIMRVSDRGGSPTELAVAGQSQRSVDGKQLLLGFQTLHAVPGADYILAGVWDGTTIEDYALVSVSLADGSVRSVMQDGVDPYYVSPGFLLFLRGSSIMSAPFDAKAGQVTGEPVQVIEGVVSSQWADKALFTASVNGTLAYVPGGRQGPGRRLIQVDPSGKSEPLMANAEAVVGGMRASPDGSEVIVTTLRRNIDVWSFSLARRSLTLVNNVGESWRPVWTPDGQAIVFQQIIPEQPRSVVRKRADGSAAAELIPIGGADDLQPSSFSPDGTLLLLTLEKAFPKPHSKIVLHQLGQPGLTTMVGNGSTVAFNGMFAPDGKHFAYVSDETGRDEVFVRTIAESGVKRQVSQAGGREPVWSRDGKKLFFLNDKAGMHAVSVDWGDGPQFSAPQKLFDTTGIATTNLWGVYDVLPDGGFVMVQPADWEKQEPRIHVVLNWREEFAKR